MPGDLRPAEKKLKIWDILRRFGTFAAAPNTVFAEIPGFMGKLHHTRRVDMGGIAVVFFATALLLRPSPALAKPPPTRGFLRHNVTFCDLYRKIAS
jgi:hypothetical protein